MYLIFFWLTISKEGFLHYHFIWLKTPISSWYHDLVSLSLSLEANLLLNMSLNYMQTWPLFITFNRLHYNMVIISISQIVSLKPSLPPYYLFFPSQGDANTIYMRLYHFRLRPSTHCVLGPLCCSFQLSFYFLLLPLPTLITLLRHIIFPVCP